MPSLPKFLLALFWVLSLAAPGLASDLQVHFINVGQGDSIFILTPDGKKILIDAGIHSGENDAKNPFLYLRGLKNKGKIDDLIIDYAVITHPHDDHYGGFKYLCDPEKDRQDFYIAGLVYSVEDPRAYGRFADCLQDLALRAQIYGQISARGPPIELGGGVELTVLYPFEMVDSPARDKNEDSIVIKVRYGKFGFLLTGDASSKVERELFSEEIESQVLKLGHHGARTSSDPDFLNRVREGSKTFYAVISADDQDGKGKTYGHPHEETLERLRALKGIRLYRTDKHGHIMFTTNGKTIQVKTEKRVYLPWEIWEPGEVFSDSKGGPSNSSFRFPEEASSP